MTAVPTVNCKICGEPVDPALDEVFGVAGKPLFAAHTTRDGYRCAEFVHAAGQTLGGFLRAKLGLKKKPFALAALQVAANTFRNRTANTQVRVISSPVSHPNAGAYGAGSAAAGSARAHAAGGSNATEAR